jgi:pantoate--beta-alanine ligase
MQIITTTAEMKRLAGTWRDQGKRIGLVPTMGALHEGHLSLLDAIRPHCDVLITSIFVNPTQFGPNEDLDRYPRDLEGDTAKLSKQGCDYVFAPDREQMYPEGYRTYINVEGMEKKLCGASRPGHFRGVATIVAKLFHITRCHVAVFGQKDYQQSVILKKMVADLNMDVEILVAPIVREADGLAMSSRNAYLTPALRKQAVVLNQALILAEKQVNNGVTDTSALRTGMMALIRKQPHAVIDYVSIVDPATLEDVDAIRGTAVAAVAVKFGTARLIDNRILHIE